jgi:hypothetical protein
LNPFAVKFIPLLDLPGNSPFGKNDKIQPKGGQPEMTLQRYPAPLFTHIFEAVPGNAGRGAGAEAGVYREKERPGWGSKLKRRHRQVD